MTRILPPPSPLPPLPQATLPHSFDEIYTSSDLGTYVAYPSTSTPAILLARSYGNLMLYYPPSLNPHPPFGVSASRPYFIWSSGGGSGCSGDHSKASVEFLSRAEFFRKHWLQILAERSIDFIFPDYECYRDAGSVKPGEPRPTFQGFGGLMWYIESLRDKTIVKTNNLWHMGSLPHELRFMAPPTHRPLPNPPDSFDPPFHTPRSPAPTASVEQQRIIDF